MSGTTFPNFHDHHGGHLDDGPHYTGQREDSNNNWQNNRQSQYDQNRQGNTQASQHQGGYPGQKQWGGDKQWGGEKKSWGGNKGGGGGGFKRAPETDFTLYLPYAVTGNPNPPQNIVDTLTRIARKLDALGFTARVGGFEGCEEIVEKAVERKELILPWRGFNNKESKFTWTLERATSVARMFHPGFDTLKKPVQTFLAKNARLILGDKMTSPVLFLLVWTEDGCKHVRQRTSKTGFSGHPIAIASSMNIPVFNLGNANEEDMINQYLAGLTLPAMKGDTP